MNCSVSLPCALMMDTQAPLVMIRVGSMTSGRRCFVARHAIGAGVAGRCGLCQALRSSADHVSGAETKAYKKHVFSSIAKKVESESLS
jgi:hypothetical protein